MGEGFGTSGANRRGFVAIEEAGEERLCGGVIAPVEFPEPNCSRFAVRRIAT